MNILVIGQNGREHALAVTYAKSPRVKKVIMTPGNGLTDFRTKKILNYPDVGMFDFDKIVDVCKKEKIDLVDVGQDDIIAKGFVDKFTKLGIKAFGPTQKASQIEWDKVWARDFMEKYKLPIPRYKSFNNQKDAIEYIDYLYSHNEIADQVRNDDDKILLYIKAAGLAAGKGAIRAENKRGAKDAILEMSQFGKAGETFVIEEGMTGEEFSLFAICDGGNYVVASIAQDHKTAFENDKGPNTGGMGSVAPTNVLSTSMIRIIEEKILDPFINGMQKEGKPYSGILYLGGMLTNNNEVKIIEFNARWGDPEAEVILPSIQTDYVDVVEAVMQKRLDKLTVKFDNKVRISVAGCSRGYPNDYSKVKGKEIFGLTNAMKMPDITIFGSGIKRKGDRFFANGGRVFYIVAQGSDIVEAQKKAYNAMSVISIDGNNLHYRKDMGWRDARRLRR